MTTDRWPKRCTINRRRHPLRPGEGRRDDPAELGDDALLCADRRASSADPAAVLRRAVDASFNRITVDGQMSTNDTVLLQASGASGDPLPAGLLDAVLLQLAIEIVRDGEGADAGRSDRGQRRRRPRGGRAGRAGDRQLAPG